MKKLSDYGFSPRGLVTLLESYLKRVSNLFSEKKAVFLQRETVADSMQLTGQLMRETLVAEEIQSRVSKYRRVAETA